MQSKMVKHKLKLGLLQLVGTLGDVSKAGKVMGYLRDSFSRFQQLVATVGAAALVELSLRKPLSKKRVEPHIEEAILALVLDHPAYG